MLNTKSKKRLIGIIDYPNKQNEVALWWGWSIYIDRVKASKVFEGVRGKVYVYVDINNGCIYTNQ